tara:strand:- start:1129 stop:1866 length:738 start_codon:yes stop_codon:yes gene_type:complete
MISTVELCVRNFVDHGVDRSQAVGFTGAALFLFGLPSAALWIKMDAATGVAFPQFLEVQDHIWGYGLMFSGLFIAFSIWKYGWNRYKVWQDENDIEGFDFQDYLDHGVSSFRDDFINTGDNDWWIGKWWDYIMYLGFPIMFTVLMGSYFIDVIFNVDNPWNPGNPKGISIVLLFWGFTAAVFILLNRWLVSRPLYRNVPEGADVPIDTLPGGEDDMILQVGDIWTGGDLDGDGGGKDRVLVAELA